MKKRIPFFLSVTALIIVLSLMLGACGQTPKESSSSAESGITATQPSSGTTGTDETSSGTPNASAAASYDAAEATAITYTESGVSISGSGAAAEGTAVTISESGTYLLSGSCQNGSLLIEGKKIQVHLVLCGLSLTNETCPAIFVKKAGSVTLTLADGSENTLTDGFSYVWEDDGSSTPDAAFFSRADLLINGSGSLQVNGNCAHGIVSKDTLTVDGGALTVTAVKAALVGKDSVTINGGTLCLTAGSDGIRSDNDEDSTLGTIVIQDGILTIDAGNDGIQAETALTVNGGTLSITAGGGSANAPEKSDDLFGGFPFWQTDSTESSESMKGLKAGGALTVNGGKITIDSADDALHTNADMQITGGELLLSTGDDGLHADGVLTLEDGKIVITQCYEGLEGGQVVLKGGAVWLTASDDGINAASDDVAVQADITISGGYYGVDAAGDGVDSNGSLHMSGGILLINGPVDSANGALDYETDASITGGIVMALGSSGMAMNFSAAENQASILQTFSTQTAGTTLSLCDAEGNLLVSFTPKKAYSSAVISAPGITVGETYTLIAGGTASDADESGFAQAGSISGGSTLSQVTVSASISGSGFGGGFGGPSAGGQGFPGGQGGKPGSSGSFTPGTPPDGMTPPTR